MNVLEKILEEIRELKCNQDSENKDYKIGYISALSTAEEIIRSRMDEVGDMYGKRLIDANVLDNEVANFFLTITGNPKQTTVVRECKESFRRMIDEQPTVYANDSWIPVEERLPNKREFQEAYCRNKYAAEFLVTIEGATRPTTLYFKNNSWFDEERNYYKVIAWQPLPEAYHPKETPAAEHIMSRFTRVE